MTERGFLIKIKDIIQAKKQGVISQEEFEDRLIELLVNDDDILGRERVIKCLLKIVPFDQLELMDELA